MSHRHACATITSFVNEQSVPYVAQSCSRSPGRASGAGFGPASAVTLMFPVLNSGPELPGPVARTVKAQRRQRHNGCNIKSPEGSMLSSREYDVLRRTPGKTGSPGIPGNPETPGIPGTRKHRVYPGIPGDTGYTLVCPGVPGRPLVYPETRRHWVYPGPRHPEIEGVYFEMAVKP